MVPASEQNRSDYLPPPHGGEGGMISLASLFALLGFVLMFSLLSNVAHTVNQKIETQTAADAVTYSASVEMARGMNAVTAANHMIGELMALVVLHHALGGDELDGLKRVQRTPWDLRWSLDISYRSAQIADIKPVASQYRKVREEPRTGGAIRDSRMRLKQVMSW